MSTSMIMQLLAVAVLLAIVGSSANEAKTERVTRARDFIGKRSRALTPLALRELEEEEDNYGLPLRDVKFMDKRRRDFIGKRNIAPGWYETPESEKLEKEVGLKNIQNWNGFLYDNQPSKRSAETDSIYENVDNLRIKRGRMYIG